MIKGFSSVTLQDILKEVTEMDILFYYLNIQTIPIIINSPLRVDKNPSFGLYSNDGEKIRYKDLSNKNRGDIYDMFSILWETSLQGVLDKIYSDISKIKKENTSSSIKLNTYSRVKSNKESSKLTDLQCKTREWHQYDIEYWESFGITLKWLKYAEIYPISYKIVIKGSQKYIFKADKFAYVYVEHKEGRVTLKIYQPFNQKYKWSNKHDSSVISLWTKVPEYGDNICICSSMKDALCLWANLGIPSIAIQGEGYNISDTAVNSLKDRYKHIFILLDNDPPGIIDAEKLAEQTGFISITLPQFEGGKDISDLYFLTKDKTKFKQIILNLFNKNKQ